MNRVIRGYNSTELIVVDGKAFDLRKFSKAAYKKVVGSGSANPGFDMPPFFYTGSPYADALLDLAEEYGVEPSDPPKCLRVIFVPHDGMYTPGKENAMWPEIFGVDFNLHFPNGPYTREKARATMKGKT